MKKHTFQLIITLVLVFLFAGCADQKVTIGLLVHSFESERWNRDKDFFVSKVNELGGEVLVRDAQNDPEKQFEQAKELIAEGVKVLVVIPEDFNYAANIVNYAHKYGVQVISYDRIIKNCNLDYYITFDNINVGEIQAEYISNICSEGNYVLIHGPTTDNNSLLVRLGQMTVLQPLIDKGDITIVYDKYASSWSKEEGYKHAKKALEENDNNIAAILAANDDIAEGAIRALKEVNLDEKVCVSGQDAHVDACKRILAGSQSMTVYKPIQLIANTAAQLAVKLAKGEKVDNMYLTVNNGKKMVPSVMLESMIVNSGTIDMTVVEQGFIEKSSIFGD